ncbi:MAG: hypothetical protein RLZZ631_1935 [Cyanobacteriota bacterium]
MNDYDLGVQLRRQILTDLERGLASDGRRLQALLGDFCADRQAALLPALKYLVLSAGFSNAVSQQPPLPADGRLQLRLQQELDQVFAPAICERMDAVLRGLLGLPAGSAAAAVTAPEPDPQLPVATAVTAAPEGNRGNGGLVALLGFIAGVLVVGVGGGLAWLWLQNGQLGSQSTLGADPAAPQQPNQPTSDPLTETTPAAPDLGGADLNRAVASVEQVYNELSLGNIQAARQLFSGTAADQFDPAFFRQFQRVSVDNLQETGRDGSAISLQGVVTFVYPDGTSQSESRSFTVDTSSDPALITASSFGQVLQGRR